MRSLLIGSGFSRARKLRLEGDPEGWDELVTLDNDPACKPDVVHDLELLPYPFCDGEFDEIHAYDVLEHTGSQGDWRFFFGQFGEFWRILKLGGRFYAAVPSQDSLWALGDPGHRRVFHPQWLRFLELDYYASVDGKPEKVQSDCYLRGYVGNFRTLAATVDKGHFAFTIEKIPLRGIEERK